MILNTVYKKKTHYHEVCHVIVMTSCGCVDIETECINISNIFGFWLGNIAY